MIFIIAALILQADALPAETWKKRNHPDMPAIPACKLDRQISADKIAKLPKDVSYELKRFFGPDGGLSEANGPFNSTDVYDGRVPSRRFLGSGLVDQSQKMTVAARATAEKKAVGQRS